MPKAASQASATRRSGYGPRRETGSATPQGRRRSSPRMSAPMAVAMSAQLQSCCCNWAMNLQECIEELVDSSSSREAFVKGSAMSSVPTRIRAEVMAYLEDKAAKAKDQPGSKGRVAIEVRERVRTHAGPPALVRTALPEEQTPSPAPPGSWLAAGRSKNPRDKPEQVNRMRKGLATWDIGRLGHLPFHAVIVYERAAGRVKEWRDKTGAGADTAPPIELLRALVHTDHVPTALASPSDHFWLPALDRWASTAEVLHMFQVPHDSPLAAALLTHTVPDEEAVSHLGRAVHVGCAKRALLEAAPLLPTSRHVRYASACSGIDTVAAGMSEIFPHRDGNTSSPPSRTLWRPRS